MESFSTVADWKGGLEQQGAHDIVGGTNHALDLAVLGGGVGTRHPELDTVRKEEGAGRGVIELPSIITLNTPNGATKLRGYVSGKVREGGEGVGLMAQRKGPRVMSAIIENNQVVLISRNTEYRRGSKIQWIKSKGRTALEDELGNGNLTCLPS